jgi:hypothetical protein
MSSTGVGMDVKRHRGQCNRHGDHNHQDRAKYKLSGNTFRVVTYWQVTMIRINVVVSFLHFMIGGNDWSDDGCHVQHVQHLTELMVSLMTKLVSLTIYPDFFLRVDSSCNNFDSRFLVGCNGRLLIVPFVNCESIVIK